MHQSIRRPLTGDQSASAADGVITVSRRGISTIVGTTAAAAGLLVSGWAVAPAAEAASSPVSITTMAAKTVSNGSSVTVTPTYKARKGVKVRSASMHVRGTASWLARGARSVKLTPGTYRVTTSVSYSVRSNGSYSKAKTTTRTQTLRVVTPPPVMPGSVVSEAYRPAAKPTPTPTPTPTTAPASIAATSSKCDSTSLRKADGTPWVCSFSDDFTGTKLDASKWMAQKTETTGYRISNDCYVDSPNNIAVSNGVLALTARKDPQTCKSPYGDYAAEYTGGMVSTWHAFDQTYGRYEIRAAFPKTTAPGLHSALWLYPKQETYGSWPLSGEIDIAEMYSQWSDRAIPYIHYGQKVDSRNPVTNNNCLIKDVSTFHTYTVEWTASDLTIAYDGVTCVSHKINWLQTLLGAAPFDKPFIIALTQGLGLGGNALTSSTPGDGTTQVDYVRVWK